MTLSRSAADKLGERLRKGTATEADWDLLEELRAERQRQLNEVVAMLRTKFEIEVTSRVKTTNTLFEKLQRERMRLSQMDDLAGARIKVVGTRLDQDAVVSSLRSTWPDARVKDRRAEPVHGYRAVHLIPTVEGWPVEIQVRTHRQDAIANVLEGLADRWGRQIRYGHRPDRPDEALYPPSSTITRSEFLAFVLEIASQVADGEALRAEVEGQDPELLGRILELQSRTDALVLQVSELLPDDDAR